MLDTIKNYIIEHKEMSKDNIEELIIDIFGEKMGYDNLTPYNVEGYCMQNKLLIEYSSLDNEDKSLSIFYNHLINKFEWGILLSNFGVYLLNSQIKSTDKEYNSHLVLFFKHGKNRDLNYFKYLSYDNMFVNHSINFFRDIILYKYSEFQGNEISWRAYHTACKRFIDYYIENGGNYNRNIELNDFKNYLLSRDKISSEASSKNAFNYIKGFMLYKGLTEFNVSANNILKEITIKDKKKYSTDVEEIEINIYKIKKLFEKLNEQNNLNSKRNKVLLLLIFSYGFTRRELCELKWCDLKDSKFNGFYIPTILDNSLRDLESEIPNTKYVLGNWNTKYNSAVTVGAINTMFEGIYYLVENDKYYLQLTPANIRRWLAKYLLNEGYSLQDIMNLMNINVSNLNSYFTMDDIKNTKCNKIIENGIHPMDKFLKQVCD